MHSLICACTEPGDLILDLFSGNGTVSASALLSNRCSVAIDIDANYVKAATVRLNTLGNSLLKKRQQQQQLEEQ